MADQEAPAALPQESSETPPARRRGRPKGSKNKKPAGVPLQAHAIVMAHREMRAAKEEARREPNPDAVRRTAWLDAATDKLVQERADALGISASQSVRDLIALGASAEAHLALLRKVEHGIQAVAANVERVTALAEADAMRRTLTAGLDPNQSINQRLDRLEDCMKSLPATLAESISQSFAPVLLALAGAKEVLADVKPVSVQPGKNNGVPQAPQRSQSNSIRPSAPPSIGGVGTRFGRPGDKPMTEAIKEKLRGGEKS